MAWLSIEQKQLLFDHAIGLASDNASVEAEKLISSNIEASQIYTKIRKLLEPLDAVEVELCPDSLVKSTIIRLKSASDASHIRLEKLIEKEEHHKSYSKTRLLPNLMRITAAAALILIAISIWFAPLKRLRLNSWQRACQYQMGQIGLGINNYKADHDSRVPAVTAAAGSPWWKVGNQGNENHSNTRNTYLLIKKGYLNPEDFICPGRKDCDKQGFDVSQINKYNDFPSRNCVTYSMRIFCNAPKKHHYRSVQPLISDLNPLFEKLPQCDSNSLMLKLSDELMKINSLNHNRRGQNVLFTDGSVKFLKTRLLKSTQDDIFTLQRTSLYNGCEIPSCPNDMFLAP